MLNLTDQLEIGSVPVWIGLSVVMWRSCKETRMRRAGAVYGVTGALICLSNVAAYHMHIAQISKWFPAFWLFVPFFILCGWNIVDDIKSKKAQTQSDPHMTVRE